jgi:SsrA-binding protein
MRAGKAQVAEAYVYLKEGEAFLFGANITPLKTASTHVVPDPIRTRKLLLNKSELSRLVWQRRAQGLHAGAARPALEGRACQARDRARAKARKQHDKRATEKRPRLAAGQGAGDATRMTWTWEGLSGD